MKKSAMDKKNGISKLEVSVEKKEMQAKDEREFVVSYRGKVYEISDFLKKHPGGSKILKPFEGTSLNEVMDQIPHSEAALHLFEDFVKEKQDDYDSIERLVDWNAPILWQVGSLTDNYWKWVHLPVNRPIRLFQSDFLEYNSNTPWFIIPIVWIPVSLYFFYQGYKTEISDNIICSIPHILIALGLGLLLWTFIEYTLHRKLFHLKPPADSRTLITLHFLLHGVHHKAPFDHQRLVFPPLPAAIITFILFNLYKVIFPQIMMHFVMAGAILGYLTYDMIHYYLHHGSPKAESYLYKMKRYHNYHHFSHQEIGFGISTKLWDHVFETLITLRRLAKPSVWQ
ncbi:fatty acid 2-hydroxylase [Belonocnema kinseyi]|uniref:fatty acid 2-hydroxylase n=1 Tax=Belonocnema kinseyi TaxID=2817044 RepID=UPI00143CFA8F|nr:fatty acid 2-hydroxylase [Belonocnema kinseyi]XP_033226575.1 fatty acid 2-hydroxylase [Belonocnema kinseyi]XP_033226576.1 fatty acid 2-hydroxylase [Belonocnema kinseyi]XP_033226577.1 fatty acid 2-hydroxylase [Belonocnema kinseyi]XP_033226578.1 fatty acid 2-hydroxylase [Belonocnema kinseyi]XP_033226579.1 fatty acid 2-hydroxylase [Belonocnema kinseyi]